MAQKPEFSDHAFMYNKTQQNKYSILSQRYIRYCHKCVITYNIPNHSGPTQCSVQVNQFGKRQVKLFACPNAIPWTMYRSGGKSPLTLNLRTRLAWVASSCYGYLAPGERASVHVGWGSTFVSRQSIIILVEIISNFSTPNATSTRTYFQKYTTLSGRL